MTGPVNNSGRTYDSLAKLSKDTFEKGRADAEGSIFGLKLGPLTSWMTDEKALKEIAKCEEAAGQYLEVCGQLEAALGGGDKARKAADAEDRKRQIKR